MPKNSSYARLCALCLQKKTASLIVWAVVSTVQPAFANGWEHTSIPLSALMTALTNPNSDVRIRAIQSLGYRHEIQVVQRLVDLIEDGEPVTRVRTAVFRSLGKIGNLQALDVIERCLVEERQDNVRAICAEALGGIPGSRSERLVTLALKDNARPVRANAITSLGSFATTTSIESLSDFIWHQDEDLKLRAIESLGNTRLKQASGVLVPLIKVDSEEKVLVQVLQAAARIGGIEFQDAVRTVYEESNDSQIRRFALVALNATRHENAYQFALQSLRDENILTRILGLEIIRDSGSKQDIGEIVEIALSQSQWLYERTRNWSSSEYEKTVLGLSVLIEYLRTITALDPRYGFELYAMTSNPPSLPATSPQFLKISEGFYNAKWQGLYGLGYTFNPSAEKILSQALQDPDPRIRAVVLRSIGIYGTNVFNPLIMQATKDDSAEVRWTASRVIGRLKSKNSVSSLLEALQDSHSKVRQEAALALGYLGDHSAIPALKNVEKTDPSQPVRQAAELALTLLR
ncbi:MAG: HEAT repeat domain-containing protein [bacterium]